MVWKIVICNLYVKNVCKKQRNTVTTIKGYIKKDFPVSFMIMIMTTYFDDNHDYDQYWHSESWGLLSGDQISSKIQFGKAGIQTRDLWIARQMCYQWATMLKTDLKIFN